MFRRKRPGRPRPPRRPKKRTPATVIARPVKVPRSRAPEAVRLRGAYLAVGVVLVVAVSAALRFAEIPLVDRFASNIATEALSLIVTLAFVQRLLEKRERAGKLRASIGALRRTGLGLSSIARTWTTLVKGSVRRSSVGVSGALEDLLSPYMTAELMHLDPQAARSGENGASERWVRWVARQLEDGRRTLRETIDAYRASLDPAYVEAIDELSYDPFVDLVLKLAETEPVQPRDWSVPINVARGHREAHFTKLLHAIELHNALAEEASRYRSRRTAPRTNSIGIDLALDEDLRVRTRVGSSWWSRAPEPGSLRLDSRRMAPR